MKTTAFVLSIPFYKQCEDSRESHCLVIKKRNIKIDCQMSKNIIVLFMIFFFRNSQ